MKRCVIPMFFALAQFCVSAADVPAVRERPAPGPALRARIAARCDLIGIVHWGLNTYTDREWGFGDEAPAMLNPSRFNADQIVGACRDGGLQGLVVVAKHHDGFCLWPTKTTTHNISRSPFRGGKGDYVREMSDACRRAGLKFGVYVSPWDRNNVHYGTEKYVEIYHAQIKELLSGAYGEVFEMWFDGANGGDGWYGGAKGSRKIGPNYYRFEEVFRFVRELQPGVTIFAGENDNSDYRWPGNERGVLDSDSRATVTSVGGYAHGQYGNPDYPFQINKGSPCGKYFRMCEADFPLRKGWFYHESDKTTVKNGAYLLKLYLGNVGNGGTMNIGIAPTRDGVLADEDVRALREFSVLRETMFSKEVASADEHVNIVEMNEDLSKGEQVDGWKLMAGDRCIASGRSIGARRIRPLPYSVLRKDLKLVITAHGGNLREVTMRCYRADPELLKAVLSADADSGETDTAKWMTGAASALN